MDCPACGAPLTLEFDSERPLSMSLQDAVFAAEADERLEISRACWDCGWQEVRQVRLESIDTTAGDEATVKRATLIDEITDELEAIENMATLEDALTEIRRHRQLEPNPPERDEDTVK